MKRLIPFLLAVLCAVGAISGAAGALYSQSEKLTFTEVVKYGDPAALDGRVIESGIRCGYHMAWKTAYTFDGENVYDTEFLFSQEEMREESDGHQAYMEVYTTSGMGGSTTGDMSLRNTGYGQMIRAVAAVTSAGEEKKMNLRLADYVDYHALCLNINYTSDRYTCTEMVDLYDHIAATWEDDLLDFEMWLEQAGGACYAEFSELFRFPVGQEEIVTVSAQRDELGNLNSIGYSSENAPEISIVCAVNDRGAYCIPVYRKGNQPLLGEYRDGMGIYFIPWKLLSDNYVNQYGISAEGTKNAGRQMVTLDCDNAENIFPMSESAIVYGLEVEEETGIARMISLEEGVYCLTQIDLEKGEILSRLEVQEAAGEGDYYWPTWQIRGDLMILEAFENLALITLGDTPVLEFTVGLGEVQDGFWNMIDSYAEMHFDGEKLVLAGSRGYYDGESLGVMVFDETGPLYWGEYDCSVFDCNDPGHSPYIQNWERRIVIR